MTHFITTRCRRLPPSRVLGDRNGFTMVEIMVVMVLLLLLAAVGLPTIKETLKSQKETQSVRQVMSFFEAARSRAIATQQPVGVVLDRYGAFDPFGRSYAIEMRQTISMPPYRGESAETLGVVIHDDFFLNNPANPVATAVVRSGPFNACLFRQIENPLLLLSANYLTDGDPANDHLAPVQPGDSIELDGSRPMRIVDINFVDNNDISLATYGAPTPPWAPMNPLYPEWDMTVDGPYIKVRFDSRNFVQMSAAAATFEHPSGSVVAGGTRLWRPTQYRIQRSPTPTSLSPLRMLKGMAIDLTYSGFGPGGIQFSPFIIDSNSGTVADNTQLNANGPVDFLPVGLVFAPDGSVQVVGGANSSLAFQAVRPTGQIFLLVGKTDGIRPDDPFSTEERAVANILDPDSVWIVINPSNGNVTASPNGKVPPPNPALSVEENLSAAVLAARSFAYNSQDLESQ